MKSLIIYRLCLILLVATAVWGCGDDADNSADPTDASDVTGEDEPFVSLCESTPDIDTWSQSPIVRTGENFSLRLTAISPDPWTVGDNDWRIEVTDLEGSAVGAVSLYVTPYMPDHGHGVSPPNYDGQQAEDGVYDIDTFNLIMPGFWEMTVTVGSQTLPFETIAFRICVES